MRACIYNRCSTEEEAQMNALGIQVEESRELVARKGWILTRQYVESQSGTTTYRRSEYQKMMEDMDRDLFDVVVVKSIDRLTRSAKDWYFFLERLMHSQKQLYIYLEQKFYTSSDNLLIGIKAILAEDFSRELSKKIKNAHRRRQEKQTGLNITVPMFGWDKVSRDVYVLNEGEAEAYRRAFAMAEEGKGFYTIAKQMYESGVRSKSGGRISEVQWRKMLHSPRAHGSVLMHTSEYDFEIKRKRNLPTAEWIEIPNALPPIVSKQYQQRVLESICNRTEKNQFRDYTRDMTKVGLYPLSGKIYCSECGKTYYRSKSTWQGEKCVVWKCSTFLKQGRKNGCRNINLMERDLLDIIRQNEFPLESKIALGEKAMQFLAKVLLSDEDSKQLAQAEKQMEKLIKKQKILSEKWLDEVITEEEYYHFRRELQEEIENLKQKRERIEIVKLQHGDGKERLQRIKERLEEDILDEALVYGRILDIEKVIVFPEGDMQILFQ